MARYQKRPISSIFITAIACLHGSNVGGQNLIEIISIKKKVLFPKAGNFRLNHQVRYTGILQDK